MRAERGRGQEQCIGRDAKGDQAGEKWKNREISHRTTNGR
jgi:hypothetical protein